MAVIMNYDIGKVNENRSKFGEIIDFSLNCGGVRHQKHRAIADCRALIVIIHRK